MNGREPLLRDLPQAVRTRLAEKIATHPAGSLIDEWDAVMDWEDRMLTFANEAASRADALEKGLLRVTRLLRVTKNNLAASVSEDEREFWERQFDNLLADVARVLGKEQG